MTRKELADLLNIYDDKCNDYTLDIWNPAEQKKYELIFTGSNNVNKTINFNVNEIALTDIEKRRRNINMQLLMLYEQQSIINKKIAELEKM